MIVLRAVTSEVLASIPPAAEIRTAVVLVSAKFSLREDEMSEGSMLSVP